METTKDGKAHYRIAKFEAQPGSTFAWGMFAGLAIELGGYGDIELVDPYSGRRFWYQPVDHAEREFDLLTLIVEAATLAKSVGWLND